ncbi:hypothetical protein A9W97_18745 [Mycobacterium gordonae]|nr:DUF732 domain-containing protein [Mycobacterium gordonae]OBJ86050.1 hypothetical protein A9W97_18745 [Mycobacterium gordonae]
MRGHGLLQLVATWVAVALSGPARADQYDFISQLDNSGVSYASITDMINIGKELCHDLRSEVSPSVVLGKLRRTGFASTESAIILTSAVDNMCPDTKFLVVAWARGNGYTGPA